MAPCSVVIVGAGLAGARCAETLRAEGYDGALTMVGDEQLPPYERPALSKEYLAGRKEEHELLLRPHAAWAEQQIVLRLGQRVVHVDPARRTAVTDTGSELGWDVLVLATGARPRRLPFAVPGSEGPSSRERTWWWSGAASWAPRSRRQRLRSVHA
jgi:3-phenylpropionate/trans-cinnamate dioxygenase ferredoxin reductase subunit